MSRYPVLQKKVYPIRDLDPLLREYLEKWSRSRLTKLINVPISGGSLASTYITPPFYRWKLEGIHNIHYSNVQIHINAFAFYSTCKFRYILDKINSLIFHDYKHVYNWNRIIHIFFGIYCLNYYYYYLHYVQSY